jgi:hypothetical protein
LTCRSTQTAIHVETDVESILQKPGSKDSAAASPEGAADISTVSADIMKQPSKQVDQLQHVDDSSPSVFEISASSVICPAQHGFASTVFISQLPPAASQPYSTPAKPDASSGQQPDEMTDVPLLDGAEGRSGAAASTNTAGGATSQLSWKARRSRFVKTAEIFFADKDNRRVLLWGCCAGSASGICEGLTGIGGPPIMVM